MSSVLSAQHSIHEGFYFLEISSLINLPWPTLMKKSLQVKFHGNKIHFNCTLREETALGLGGWLGVSSRAAVTTVNFSLQKSRSHSLPVYSSGYAMP